ncbi:hypothetical protein LX99_00653 [Mucilaginibacter oryzae]|uniref:Uncharacterized protein n=1 Tax=Mucilaginibacter oryzae TaxID=468058 RepID=A0A316HG32_9SPHI|nr:hypothetical protein LX99_00653 [Mucilaginibacter oryzae]
MEEKEKLICNFSLKKLKHIFYGVNFKNPDYLKKQPELHLKNSTLVDVPLVSRCCVLLPATKGQLPVSGKPHYP